MIADGRQLIDLCHSPVETVFDRFQVVAVNLDQDPMKGVSFLERVPVGYPSGSDPDGAMPQAFGVETMPTSFLIDAKGIVRYVHPGFRKKDIDDLRERIRALLADAGA